MNKKLFMVIACAGFVAPAFSSASVTKTGPAISFQSMSQEQLQQRIGGVIQEFEQSPRDDWSYRVTRYENEEGEVRSSIELFDPSKKKEAHQWTLLKWNDKQPSAQQISDFIDRKLKAADEPQSLSVRLSDMIQLDTLALISEDQSTMQASFGVQISRLGEKVSEKLQGVLRFNKTQAYIEELRVTNSESFSPVFSAEIDEFELVIRFMKIDTTVLPQQHAFSMKGSFAFFTQIEEVSTDTFSDYRYLGK